MSTPPSHPHAEPVEDVLAALDTSATGLSKEDADARLEAHGPNELVRERPVSPVRLFLTQFTNLLVALLLLAAVISLAVGLLPDTDPNYVDAILILVILLANAIFGFVQEYRSARALEALRDLETPSTTVRRDGTLTTIDAREVVRGDLVVLEAGDAVPADARVVESNALETDESALTGESASVQKTPEPVDEATSLAERSSVVYKQTTVVAGRGTAVVTATGMDTEVGAIAEELRDVEDEPTTFQRDVDRLGRRIAYGVLALIAAVALIQFFITGTDTTVILLVAITLAVAAVPEGLPAIVTVTLALGSRRLLARNVLIRRLPVVESLGSIDTIATDKTGTITQNEMTVTRLGVGTDEVRVDVIDALDDRTRLLLECGVTCSNAEPSDDGFLGDPTDVAVSAVADRFDVPPVTPRHREIPFSADRKRMTVIAGDDPTVYVKGSPEEIRERCEYYRIDGERHELTHETTEHLRDRMRSFAEDALRVIAFATKPAVEGETDPEELESNLTFLGFEGMMDPLRPEVTDAIADCRRAGIRTVLLTGDTKATACAIGEQIGLDVESALTGDEITGLSDDELEAIVEDVDVFARVSPTVKLRILHTLQANGHVVAMTGDGVNDAPSLRGADVGIAMGIRGTDVARQAADVVLQDDNYATIRDAVEEGRGIFDNVQKFVNYLLSANAGEVFVVFFGVLLGSILFTPTFTQNTEALILTPVMLLWINLVTDGFPALALAADPKSETVMDRRPRDPERGVIDRPMAVSIIGIAIAMTIVGLGVYFGTLTQTESIVHAQTTLFTFLVVVELVRLQVIRERYDQSVFTNRLLIVALATTIALQLAVLYTPLRAYFQVIPLDAAGWTVIAVGFVVFLAGILAIDRLTRDHTAVRTSPAFTESRESATTEDAGLGAEET